jgi:hypothetical protein
MNKMFKKLMAVSATVAIAATMSVSAFAAGETATHENGSVSVTDYAAVAGATQYTVMLFEDSFATNNDVSKIYYINQGADPAALLTGMLVKATTAEDGTTSNALPDGDYTVRIGNDKGTVVDVDLKVETKPAGVQITLNYGDVNGDGSVGSADASLILQKVATIIDGFTDTEGRAIPETVADVNGDGSVGSADASLILQKVATIIDGFTNTNGEPLTTYTYTYVAPTE